MLDANGEIVEWFGTARDVTARKRTEEELRRLNATLEQTVQERTKELALKAEELRALAGELTLAEQRERQRLARALHDGLQQILVGARYRLNSAARSTDIPSELNKISGLIADAIETSRSLTAELNPTRLLQGDLLSSLEWLVRWMQDKYSLDVSLISRRKIKPLAENGVLLLSRILR